jgi:hypothetical protein
LDVTPSKNAAGKMVCPRCNNTGKPAFAPTPATWSPPNEEVTTRQELPGATAAMVLGILGCLGIIGLILSIIALVMANKALRVARANPGRYDGEGRARAGRILAIVFLCIDGVVLLVVLAAVIFVTVSNLSAANNGTASPVFHA